MASRRITSPLDPVKKLCFSSSFCSPAVGPVCSDALVRGGQVSRGCLYRVHRSSRKTQKPQRWRQRLSRWPRRLLRSRPRHQCQLSTKSTSERGGDSMRVAVVCSNCCIERTREHILRFFCHCIKFVSYGCKFDPTMVCLPTAVSARSIQLSQVSCSPPSHAGCSQLQTCLEEL